MQSLEYLYHNADDMALSILIFALSVLFCDLLRLVLLNGSLLSMLGMNRRYYRLVIAEMIGSLEVCVMAFEINYIIYDVFGVEIYTFMVFVSLMWQHKRSSSFFYYASPCSLLEEHVKAVRSAGSRRFSNYKFLFLMTIGELVGAFFAYHLMTLAWRNSNIWTFWKSSNHHMKRFSSPWQSSFNDSSVGFAMLIEGGFSFLNSVWPAILKYKLHFRGNARLIMSNLGKAVFCGIGAQYTGGYYNPLQSTALEFGSSGTFISKFQVYWVAPLIGTLIPLYLP